LLLKHFKDTSHPEILKTIRELAAQNPTVKAAHSSLNEGDWEIISAPNFHSRITPQPGQKSLYQFTLGNMAKDMFEPSNLVCTVNTVIYSIPKSDQITLPNGENKCNL